MNGAILAVTCIAVGAALGFGLAAFHIVNTFWDVWK